MKRNGSITAHNREWPTYERSAYSVEVIGMVVGEIDGEKLQADLQQVLDPYGLTAQVLGGVDISMLPEDEAEKERLDRLN